MKRRAYDFLGFAGAFAALAAVVVVWAIAQSNSAPQNAAAASSETSSPTTQPNSATANNDNAVAPRVGEMGETKVAPLTSNNAKPGAHPPAKTAGIAWETSYEDAVKRASAEGKPMMVDFYTDWCSACKFLDANVYTDPGVVKESQQFVCVKVNAEQRTDLAGAYRVQSYPTVGFMRADSKGNRLLGTIAGIPMSNPQGYFVQVLQAAKARYAQVGIQQT